MPVKACKGFTILEILVVIAIVSMVVTTLLLNTRFHDPADDLKQHGNRLSKYLQLLSQEAVFESLNFAINIQPGKYQLLQYDGAEWVLEEDKFFTDLQKSHRFTDELVIDKSIIAIKKSKTLEPHILILSSGEMTPFEWSIRDRENQLTLKLESNLLGNIMMTGPSQNLL